MRQAAGLLAALILVQFGAPVSAGQVHVVGVVWQQSHDFSTSASDLRKIRASGFTAIRTNIIQDSRLLQLADDLGLSLYQELPVEYLPASQIRDSLEHARQMLELAINTAQNHRSAQTFGVARYVDSSDPRTCDVIREIVEYGRSLSEIDLQFYYVTPFASHDQCSAHVDFVLIDGPDHEEPADRLRSWNASHETPAGLAGAGSWIRTDVPDGLQNPRSPQQQGQYLERVLNDLLVDRLAPAATAIFVYRWRDSSHELPLLSDGDPNPYITRYGLHDVEMEERPAFEVAAGIASGRQSTFAFPYGEEIKRDVPWVIIFGWASVLLVGLTYALSPRLQQMLPRYFFAHGFYRDALREGRELLLGSSFVLLIALSIAAGVTAGLVVNVIDESFAFRVLLEWMPEGFVFFLAPATSSTWMFILLIGAIYAGLVLGWIILIMLISRTRFALGIGQATMLVVWPHWPLLILMMAGLGLYGSTETLTEVQQITGVLLLLGLWLAVSLYATIRAVIDFSAVARVPAYAPVVVLALNPTVIAAIILCFTVLQYQDETVFLIHLLQRS